MVLQRLHPDYLLLGYKTVVTGFTFTAKEIRTASKAAKRNYVNWTDDAK